MRTVPNLHRVRPLWSKSPALSGLLVLALAAPLAAQTDVMLRRVVGAIEQAHLIRPDLDDVASERAFQQLLDTLDPSRMYFLASDLDGYADARTEIDDMARLGETAFVRDVFDRLGVRMAEAVSDIEARLAEPFDFDLDETYPTRADRQPWAKDREERRDRWRRRLKLDLLSLEDSGVEGDAARERLVRRYKGQLERLQELRTNEVDALLANAVLGAFDPHSSYLPPRQKEDFDIHLRLRYQGIGAILRSIDGVPTISQVLPGGAADLSGSLHAGDRIVAVGQADDDDLIDVVGKRLDDVVRLIRGPEGTVVRLSVEPAAGGAAEVVVLERAPAELAEAAASGLVFEIGEGEAVRHIGLVDLPSFYGGDGGRSASRDIREILDGYRDRGDIDAVILDLRSNGGGLLPEAIDVAGLFIDRGPVVQVANRRRAEVLEDEDRGVSWAGPLLVMTNSGSASASEIVAGAIKDYGRGLVVGGVTHGKGTVQQVAGLGRTRAGDDLGALALTVQQFYRPGGLSTQQVGVRPDVELPSARDSVADREGDLPNVLPVDRREAADYDRLLLVDEKIVAEVRRRSDARRVDDPDFVRQGRLITLLAEREQREGIPLRRDVFMAERKEIDDLYDAVEGEGDPDDESESGDAGDQSEDAGKTEEAGEAEATEEDPAEEDPAVTARRRLRRDAWLREACAIAVDYRELLGDRALAGTRGRD